MYLIYGKNFYWMNLESKKSQKNIRSHPIASVHLDCHIIAPINDTPLIPIPYPSNNTLHCSQIDNLIGAKFLIAVDIVC
jgi:hypothetical protein